MGSALVIIEHEASKVAEQVTFTEDDHVIQALAANRADHAFDVCALPW